VRQSSRESSPSNSPAGDIDNSSVDTARNSRHAVRASSRSLAFLPRPFCDKRLDDDEYHKWRRERGKKGHVKKDGSRSKPKRSKTGPLAAPPFRA
jgi:hypothetical protein